MPSIIKQTLNDMKARALEVTGVNSSSIWNNDLVGLRDGSDDTVICPHICIEFEIENSQALLHGVTQHDIIWKVHILHRQDADPNGGKGENMDVFDFRDAVKVKFSRYVPKNCTSLQYMSEYPDYDHDNIYKYTVVFKSSFIDTKGSPFDADSDEWLTKTPDELPLTLEITAEVLPEDE